MEVDAPAHNAARPMNGECPICNIQYDEKRKDNDLCFILDCEHFGCLKCLHAWAGIRRKLTDPHTGNPLEPNCPICRTTYDDHVLPELLDPRTVTPALAQIAAQTQTELRLALEQHNALPLAQEGFYHGDDFGEVQPDVQEVKQAKRLHGMTRDRIKKILGDRVQTFHPKRRQIKAFHMQLIDLARQISIANYALRLKAELPDWHNEKP